MITQQKGDSIQPRNILLSSITSVDLKKRKYAHILPEYYALAALTENSGAWHVHQNVLTHVIGVFEGLETILKSGGHKKYETYLSERIEKKSRKEILIAAALLHDIAKNDTLITRPDGTTNCPGHELVGAGRVNLFAKRFGLGKKDEAYVERIVRYHGFISQILTLIVANGHKEKYARIFQETVGDVAFELTFLMHADLLGSDIQKNDRRVFDEGVALLTFMADKFC